VHDADTFGCGTRDIVVPAFQAMDADNNNRVDADEWAGAERQKTAIAKGCKASETSWCPCQNNLDDPECQK
jgi:hypothetical protein